MLSTEMMPSPPVQKRLSSRQTSVLFFSPFFLYNMPLRSPFFSSSSSIIRRGLLASSARFSRIPSIAATTATRSFFQTAPRASLSTSPHSQLHRLNTTRAMSSATTFYDFEPADSALLCILNLKKHIVADNSHQQKPENPSPSPPSKARSS